MKKLDNRGNVAIIVCVAMTVLLGFMAYTVDIGLAYAEKIKLSNSIDSAALAASLELPNGDTKTMAVANDYLQKNGVNPSNASITIGTDHKSIQIDGVKNISHVFAPIIGIKNNNIYASTMAVIGPAKSINKGIRPFAVQMFNYTYGSLVTLKEDAGSGYQGNYSAVALGGRGSSVFESNSLYGYNGKISAGDWIDTETGNMAGATNDIKNYISSENSTFDNFPRNSIRLWTIPLVNTLQVNGRGQIQVMGFGEFYVENVGQKSGNIEVTGRFVRFVTNSPIDTTLSDTGAYGTKLAK